MIYLFLQSVVPTVPAAWLTFAEGAVYRPTASSRCAVWGLSVTDDQQLAGAIMKTGGSIFLWTIIVTLWFKRFSARYRHEHDYRRARPSDRRRPPPTRPTLTFDDVDADASPTHRPSASLRPAGSRRGPRSRGSVAAL